LLDLAENRRPYSKIDVDERRKIARWRIAGICVEAIAGKVRFMGRSLQLIS